MNFSQVDRILFQVIDVRGPKGKTGIFFTFLHGLELRSSRHNLLCTVYNVQITSGNLWNTGWCFSQLGQHLMLSHVIHSLPCNSVCSRNSAFGGWAAASVLCMECSTSMITGFFFLLQLDFNKGKLEKILRSSSTAPWYYRQPLFVIPYVNWSSPLKPVIFLWPSEKAAVYLFISFFLNTALTLPSFCYSQRLSSLLQQMQQNLRKSSTKCTKK